MQRFTKLQVWQRSRASVVALYRATASFPSSELFGLVTQLRRAAVSISSNIAEGAKRVHSRDFARFLNVAEGSTAEVQSLLLLSSDLGFLDPEAAASLLRSYGEIGRMLYGLRRKVEQGVSGS